ncbi:MAG TPA: protein translocase subunit SecD [Acidimicrobiia bacterium]|nr:protein translocase subunit SecD [Acidimicrobiia bacterium]
MKIYLAGSIIVVIGAIAATIVSGNKPVLGLDLKGGISVTYQPVGRPKPGALTETLNIMNNRVNSFGVAEPSISRQGNDIVVELPGVKDQAKALRLVGRTAQLRFRPVLANIPALPATKPGTTTTTLPKATEQSVRTAIASCDAQGVSSLLSSNTVLPTTALENDNAKDCVILPVRNSNQRLLLAPVTAKASTGVPAGLNGSDVSSATSTFQSGQGYAVEVTLKSEGLAKFNALAAASYDASSPGSNTPRDEVAIVLDGVVYSNPAFQTSTFNGPVQITGSFSQGQASDLATVINYGALPVQLNPIDVQQVSPTLGSDQLNAGIAAGIIGLALVALYMLLYYRILGIVVFLGLGVSGALLYAIVSGLGPSLHLALTLSGVTGIIVSVGITVDSYVVYYERLKDEVRTGRTVRSSVDRGFARSFRTIVAADLVSLIGAGALWALAIGSVKGFALFLGLATILDLIVSYFFMHPLVSLLARRPNLVRMPGVGIAAGLDVPAVQA